MKKQNNTKANGPIMILMGMESGPEIKWIKCPKCNGDRVINGAKCSGCDGTGKVRA